MPDCFDPRLGGRRMMIVITRVRLLITEDISGNHGENVDSDSMRRKPAGHMRRLATVRSSVAPKKATRVARRSPTVRGNELSGK